MKNRLDSKAKRGAVVKALAVGSTLSYVPECFKSVASALLDRIFEAAEDPKTYEATVKNLLSNTFNNCNNQEVLNSLCPRPLQPLDFIKKQVLSSHLGRNCFSALEEDDHLLFRCTEKLFVPYSVPIKVSIPQLPQPEDFSHVTSLRKFLMKFGEKTMLIYDALLSEKRILFSGGLDHSASEIADYVLACAELVAPPLLGISSRLYPYAALSNLDFLEEPGFVAGVTNPVFSQRQNWHDLCAEVDLGKLKVSKNKDFYNYEQEKYFQLDMDFIRTLITKVKHNEAGSSDEELRKAFESYTLLTLDLALGIEDGL
jgi:hypothetical protein